ncbi:hypothetical protein [Bacillus cereus]|uniref:hypothetical protein n=1 Tax=Bacillus cereus TaxID=1396 RepID=UPI00159715D7|nr:hypothetical protein [Bacillus cereus]
MNDTVIKESFRSSSSYFILFELMNVTALSSWKKNVTALSSWKKNETSFTVFIVIA